MAARVFLGCTPARPQPPGSGQGGPRAGERRRVSGLRLRAREKSHKAECTCACEKSRRVGQDHLFEIGFPIRRHHGRKEAANRVLTRHRLPSEEKERSLAVGGRVSCDHLVILFHSEECAHFTNWGRLL